MIMKYPEEFLPNDQEITQFWSYLHLLGTSSLLSVKVPVVSQIQVSVF